MTIAVVHHMCSEISGMCTRADGSTKTDSESRGRLCPDKPTTTCSAAWRDVVSARLHLMIRDEISAVIIISVYLHRNSFRVLTGAMNWESTKLLRPCFYLVWDRFSVQWNMFRCIFLQEGKGSDGWWDLLCRHELFPPQYENHKTSRAGRIRGPRGSGV